MIIIPARYGSTRFPGKPLANIKGESMLQRVYNQCLKTGIKTYIATDDFRIKEHVISFGGDVVMTDSAHQSGTDRCAEVYKYLGSPDEIVVNVQGDEPFIKPEQILSLVDSFKNTDVEISTLIKKIDDEISLFNPNVVKVIKNKNNAAIYFSRHPIPYLRGVEKSNWIDKYVYYKHIGVYAFKGKIIDDICSLPSSSLETAESLEQLRWIENGYKIYAVETNYQSPAIDTPEDLIQILKSNIDVL
jgi:3-deoxy-manno-octulosonate cytidylyltransferase (CMP-KDO synthetase)